MSGLLTTPFRFGAAQTVSTLTVLQAFTEIGWQYEAIKVTLSNQSATDAVFLKVDLSQDGTRVDNRSPDDLEIAASAEGSVVIGAGHMWRYIRASAHSTSPGFPSVSIKWEICGINR